MTRALFRFNAALYSFAGWTLWLLKGGRDGGSLLTTAGSIRRLREHAALWRKMADEQH